MQLQPLPLLLALTLCATSSQAQVSSALLREGDVLTGTVASVERFGVFVELVDGLEGLLHASELERNDGANMDYNDYAVGQQVTVCVLEIVPEEHRIALGLVDRERPYDSA